MKTALYPGTFDPLTNGHLDVIRRATHLFDQLIVAIGDNTEKKRPIFSVPERIQHLKYNCSEMQNIQITSFTGLLTDAVHEFDAVAVVRGLRAVADFEWEFQMALMNRALSPSCETVFLMPSAEYSYISSSMICEIAELGGDVSPFVPSLVAESITERVQRQ